MPHEADSWLNAPMASIDAGNPSAAAMLDQGSSAKAPEAELNSCAKATSSVTLAAPDGDNMETASLSSTSSSMTLVADGHAKSSSSTVETSNAKTDGSPPAETPAAPAKESESTNKEPNEKEDPKKETGWLNRKPFSIQSQAWMSSEKNCISWYELTLREKYEYRKKFLLQYFSETKACLPYVKRLFFTIVRISPWRGAALLFLNVANAVLPAMALRAQGDFLIQVLFFALPC
jgi:hypothetical protein